MAGNILYIPYTILMLIGLIGLAVLVVKLKKGKRAIGHIVIISMPIMIIFQFYFWNVPFNAYVKSYLFPSTKFECVYEYEYEYEDDLRTIAVPLPARTVFQGKQDVCSPFYTSYITKSGFEAFYEEELKTMKDEGAIQSYQYSAKYDGYTLELRSGSTIDIFYHRREGSRLITIDYESNL